MAAFTPASLSEKEKAAFDAISEGTNKFAVSLYRALASNETGNVFVSPLTVQMVLALAYTGAKGETAQELAALLSLPGRVEDTYAGHQSLFKLLQAPVLKMANCMFVEKTAELKKDFQKNAGKYFHSPAEALDFRCAADKSLEKINSWVEKQTNKKITNLLQPGSINVNTRLVLVNAIHFKADWMSKFREEDTKEKPFHVSRDKTVQVPMMHSYKELHIVHDEELGAKLLKLDYEKKNFCMIFILPDDIEGLPALEAKLENVNLGEKTKYMGCIPPNVTVALPKFKMEETMELNDILKSMGAKTMFTAGEADFGGLSDEKLFVSKVAQKAFVEVNEEGTEAAAATYVRVQCCSGRIRQPPDQQFIADHPFLFFITHRMYRTPVFIGRYTSPPEI